MNAFSSRGALRRGCLAAGVFLVTAGLMASAALPATAAQDDRLDPIAPSSSALDQQMVIDPALLAEDGPVTAFIQIEGEGALAVQRQLEARGRSSAGAASTAEQTAEKNTEVNTEVTAELTDIQPTAEVLYTSTYSVPGIAVTADPATLSDIAERSDVVRISPIVQRSLNLPDATAEPQNAASDALTRAVEAWQQTGNTGKDVTVAVIDTGLDYTHATFGGPGTTTAYNLAVSSTAAPQAALFDASKYLGGWDFAGTSYNGSAGTPVYNPVPHTRREPDRRPRRQPRHARGRNRRRLRRHQ